MRTKTLGICALATMCSVEACGGAPDTDADDIDRSRSAHSAADRSKHDWRMAAYDPAGTGHNSHEHRLNRRTVSDLEVKWTFDEASAGEPVASIHANPVVADGRTFVGSVGGVFYAIGEAGELLWSFETFAPGPLFQIFFGARAPIVGGAVLPEHEDSVVFGDGDGRVYKLDRATGALAWTFDLDDHDLGGIWGNSLMIVGDTVYVGMASFETLAPFFPERTCCTHRGAVIALDLATGATRWRHETIDPAEQGPLPPELVAQLGGLETFGPSGADVWSQPTYDARTDTIFASTGQLFSRRPDGTGTDTFDAIVALDAETGARRWARSFSEYPDVFRFDIPFLDPVSGRYFDKDMGDQPKVYRIHGKTVVGAGQKSGEYHVVDAETGALVRSTPHIEMITGEGGFQSGGATDGKLAYQHGTTTPAAPGLPFDGVVMGLDGTGATEKWAVRIPGSAIYGSLAVAGGVVYFQSPYEDQPGGPPTWALYAVHGETGEVLARIPFPGRRALNGPAVSRGRVYAGFGGTFGFGPATPVPEGGVVCLGLPGKD